MSRKSIFPALLIALFALLISGCNNENSGLPSQNRGDVVKSGATVPPPVVNPEEEEPSGEDDNSGTDSGDEAAIVVSLEVTPNSTQLPQGTTQQLTAIANYSNNSTKDVTNAVEWVSEDTGIATISSTGLVTAVSDSGTSTMTASLENNTASAEITVIAPELVQLNISPLNETVAMNQLTDPDNSHVQYNAEAVYSDGSVKPVTDLVAWESDNTSLATILSSGLATPIAEGVLNIQASFTDGGVTKSAATDLTVDGPELVAITVSPKNLLLSSTFKVQLYATGQYSDGSTQDLTDEVSWNYSEGSCVIDDSNPNFPDSCFVVLEGADEGAATGVVYNDSFSTNSEEDNHTFITATSLSNPSLTDSADITARDDTSLQVTINPAVIDIPKGFTAQLTATAVVVGTGTQLLSIDATDLSVNGTTHINEDDDTWEWSVADGATLDITQTGVLTALEVGSSSITFSRDAENSAQINVKDIQVTNLMITESDDASVALESPFQLPKGSSEKIKVIATFDDGSTYDVTDQAELALVSEDADVATVIDGNEIYANNAGTTNVTATFDAVSTEPLNITVSDVAVTQIVVTAKSTLPTPLNLAIDTTAQLIATATFEDGSTRDITDEADWTTADSKTVSVNQSGLVTANDVTGGTQINASFRGHVGSASIEVTDKSISTVVVTPVSTVMKIGETVQLTAIAEYDDGTQQDITELAVWYSTEQTIASITGSGLIQAIGVGGVNVLFFYDGTGSLVGSQDPLSIVVTE